MTGAPFLIRIRAAGICLFVPGEHAFVGPTGFFVREMQLPVGTRVVVQFCRGEETVSLGGTVYASYGGLGLSVGFEETSGLTIERLNTLLAA